MKGFKDVSKSRKKILKKEIISKAFSYHSDGNIIEAGKKYQYFLDQGFKDARVFSNYAIILKELNKYDDALALINQAIKIYPERAELYSILSDIFRQLSRLDEARLSLNEAIKLNPNEANYYLNLGIIYINHEYSCNWRVRL